MKTKHNKKRNTAFVFEALMREATVAIMKGDPDRKDAVLKIVRTHFKSNTDLRRHLECYKSLYENQDIPAGIGEKILQESKIASRALDPEGLFKQQTQLINDVNKDLSPDVFNNFVPNYKTLATIDQIFSDRMPPKKRVMLETNIIKNMSRALENNGEQSDVDNVTLRSFTEKFNEKYCATLTQEQQQLLSYYITSFTDNAVELKTFLNEEIVRLKEIIEEASGKEIFASDEEMANKATQIIAKLNNYRQTEINEGILLSILKTQQLAKELTNGSHN